MRLLRGVDEASEALRASVAGALRYMREAADDPTETEGRLRDHLRQAAGLIEHLTTAHTVLAAFNRRSVIRFGILAVMFTVLAVYQIARQIWEGLLP